MPLPPHAYPSGLAALLLAVDPKLRPEHVASDDRMATAIVNALDPRTQRYSQACRDYPAVRSALAARLRLLELEESA